MFSLLPCDAPSSWKMQIANKLLLDRFHVAHFMETQQPDPLRISCFCAITLIYLIKTCYWFISLFSGESLNLKTKSQTNICTLYVWSDTSLEEMSQGVQECSPKNVSDAQTPRPLVKELHPWVKIPQHSLHMCASHFDKPTSALHGDLNINRLPIYIRLQVLIAEGWPDQTPGSDPKSMSAHQFSLHRTRRRLSVSARINAPITWKEETGNRGFYSCEIWKTIWRSLSQLETKRRQGSFCRTVYKEIHMFDPSWKSPVTSVFDKQGNVGNEILMIWRLGGKKTRVCCKWRGLNTCRFHLFF